MKTCVYPGSFDPITFGHLDIIKRASELFDRVIVCIMINNKKNSFFTLEQRKRFIEKSIAAIPNVEVDIHEGLLVDYLKNKGCKYLVRGLRNSNDFQIELDMAHMIRSLYEDVETLFLMTQPKHSYISSSNVREILSFDGDISGFVPKCVENEMKKSL